MTKIKFTRKSDFLFRAVNISINNINYKLKRNSSREIDLPAGIYKVVIRLDWSKTYRQIEITEKGQEFVITQTISDWYFLFGLFVIFLLTVLTLFDIIPVVVQTTALMIYAIPLMIHVFVNKKSYFKIIPV